MPERSRKRPTDLNALAVSIVSDATAEDKPEPEDDGKDPAAVALGRRGGLKGGRARAVYVPARSPGAVDRHGPRAVAAAGTLLMILARLLGLIDALATRPLYAVGVLLLVGLAWSTQVVAASTWLSRAVPPPAQAAAEGAGEAGMSAAAALGGLATAPLLAAGGTHAVMAAIVMALVVTTLTLRRLRD